MSIDVNDLMIHVERIVRPVRATERRKLQMRRELLGHLQAALEEEREGGAEDGAALEGAKRRLGVPEELTRGLQRSVPMVERTLLGRLPLGKTPLRWERKMGESMGMGRMSMLQQTVFTVRAGVLAYGTMVLLGLRIVRLHREAMMQAFSGAVAGEWGDLYLVGNGAAALLLFLLMGTCFGLVGAAARGAGWRKYMWYGGWITAWVVGWHVSVVMVIAGQGVGVMDIVLPVVAAGVNAAGLVGLGKLTHKVGQPYRDWLALNIAEGVK